MLKLISSLQWWWGCWGLIPQIEGAEMYSLDTQNSGCNSLSVSFTLFLCLSVSVCLCLSVPISTFFLIHPQIQELTCIYSPMQAHTYTYSYMIYTYAHIYTWAVSSSHRLAVHLQRSPVILPCDNDWLILAQLLANFQWHKTENLPTEPQPRYLAGVALCAFLRLHTLSNNTAPCPCGSQWGASSSKSLPHM